MGHIFGPGNRAYGPKDLVCDSCHRTEFLLREVTFSDGTKFRVCGMCADEAHRVLEAVFDA